MAFVDIQSQTLKELGLGHTREFGPAAPTLLHAFLHVASSAASAERAVVECGTERWSYRELDIISSGLAKDLKDAYGPKPTVAFIAENHPYVLAIMLATWKIGGIIAPMDHHVPKDIMERMLGNIRPQCIVVPEAEIALQKTLKGSLNVQPKSHTDHLLQTFPTSVTSFRPSTLPSLPFPKDSVVPPESLESPALTTSGLSPLSRTPGFTSILPRPPLLPTSNVFLLRTKACFLGPKHVYAGGSRHGPSKTSPISAFWAGLLGPTSLASRMTWAQPPSSQRGATSLA